ncbi:unnamed protein product [Sphagnum tenellum]
MQIVLTLDCCGVEEIQGITYGYWGFFEEDLNDISCLRPNVRVAVVGVPKTIDNDTTFGFDTTVEEAQKAINMACIEVLMSRVALLPCLYASLANGQVDACLIPEVSDPKKSYLILSLFFAFIGRLSSCFAIAHSAGEQDLLTKSAGTDASVDIAVHLTKEVKKHFKNIGVAADDKYIDPTYMICACLTSASVSILCAALGQNVVHVGSSLERHEPAKPLHVDLTTINE